MEQQWNEEALLTGVTNQFGIYQINETSDAGEFMFESKAYMDRMGIELTRDKYDLVYVAPWDESMDLEKIFTKFNIDRPADFKGHSLSMSDIVLIHENGENTAHYVDTIGFAELPDFLPKEPVAEIIADNMAPEAEAKRYINEFKAMTGEYFHEIGGMKHDDLEAFAQSKLQEIMSDYGINASITAVAVVGTRARGIEEREDPVEVMFGVNGSVDTEELKQLFNREGLLSNDVKIEAQVVPAAEGIEFAAYLQMEQMELARKQVQYVTDHKLSEDQILGAQIGAYLTENSAVQSIRDTDTNLIAKDIREGNTGHLTDYFKQMSSDADASRAAQAKEYLDKLLEYKPLAKVEEVVEQNYNMIDNVINNTKPQGEPHKQEEQKKASKDRQSLRERLEEKKRFIAQLPVSQAEKAQINKFPDVREP